MTIKLSKTITGTAIASSLLFSQITLASDMTKEEADFLVKMNQMLENEATSAFSVKKSIFPSLFEVDLSNGTTIIVDKNGEYGVVGGRGGAEVFNFKEGESLTRDRRSSNALSYVQGKEPFITYKAKREQAEIYVFADIQCGYCQQLHESIPELNASGITVNYVPFAMFENSDVYMNAAYCSENPSKTYTEITDSIKRIKSKANKRVQEINGNRQDYSKLVAEGMSELTEYAMSIVNAEDCNTYDMEDVSLHAKGFGISGTPNILFTNGKMVQGAIEVKSIQSLAF